MMQHADIWRGVDLLAEKHGLSPSRLAKLAGLDATAFNKSKRISKDGRLRWPSTESLARALAAVDARFSDFASLVDGEPAIALPVLALQSGTAQTHFDANGLPIGQDWERLHFPMLDVAAGAYVLEITDYSMEPSFRRGDRLVVSPRAQIRPGDQVVWLERDGDLATHTVLRQTDSHITLGMADPELPSETRALQDIAWIARIMWVSQ